VIRFLSSFAICLATMVAALAAVWSAGALYFDIPAPASVRAAATVFWLLGVIVGWFFMRPRRWARVAVGLGFLGVTGWWMTIPPRQDRNWKPEVAVLADAVIDGERVTIHQLRNFDYRTETDFTPRYDTRRYDLTQLRGLDLFVNYWGSPLIAHPILSFDFGDQGHICFSIETRPERGESYSAIRGFYRQFELIYIAADERDVIRVRTNYRKGEDVYLYRTTISLAQARERFLEYVDSLNAMREKPRWYNAITTNCTTSIRTQRPPNERMPWDWRILLNGKGDEMMYERHLIVTGGLPFAELKARSLINARAKSAGAAPDFSQLIRVGVPGYE
jgi:Domain of unknown function (DUF4105)